MGVRLCVCSYLRITSEVDPSTVRPIARLTAAFEELKRRWSVEEAPDYTFVCEQMKCIRQDLTLQGVRNDFTVQVRGARPLPPPPPLVTLCPLPTSPPVSVFRHPCHKSIAMFMWRIIGCHVPVCLCACVPVCLCACVPVCLCCAGVRGTRVACGSAGSAACV